MYNVKKIVRLVICRGKDLPSVAIDIERKTVVLMNYRQDTDKREELSLA